jgi:HAD superfamily hydrolase (TIGR01509 family)
MLTLEKGLPAALHKVVTQLKQLYTREEILGKCWPSFDKEYMISRLKREGLRLGVCSNATRESVDLMLRRSAILDYFDVVLGNEDVARPKPDPAIYLEAMTRLGLAAKETLIVEDAGPGIEAARGSGAHIAVVGGFAEVDYWRVDAALQAVAPRC